MVNKDAGFARRPIRYPRAAAADGTTELNVALYPYVPRPQQFESVVQAAWSALYPQVTLNFVDYDCYSSDPPPTLDVFAFDTIFTQYFQSMNYLQAIDQSQIDNWEGLFDFALAAAKVNGTPYAIPYLGCVTTFFYRSGDEALQQANSLQSIYEVMGNSTDPTNPQPPPGQGLLIDYTGGTTDCCMYLQTVQEINNQYPSDPYLPPSPAQFDQQAIGNLQTYTLMAGVAQASYNDPGQQRVDWFTSGLGRAYVGVTESMASFPASVLPSIRLKVLPLAQQVIPQPFYADGLGINSQIDPSKLQYALALANLIASEDVLYNSMIPQDGSNPQFLIPARGAVLANLIDVSPLYQQIADIVLFHVREPFVIGTGSRGWINSIKNDMRAAILNVSDVMRVDVTHFDDTPPHPADLSKPVHLARRL